MEVPKGWILKLVDQDQKKLVHWSHGQKEKKQSLGKVNYGVVIPQGGKTLGKDCLGSKVYHYFLNMSQQIEMWFKSEHHPGGEKILNAHFMFKQLT